VRSPAAIPEPFPRPTRAHVPRIPLATAAKTCAGTVGSTAHGGRSGPAQAPERDKSCLFRAAALARLFATRGRRLALLCLAVLLVDQVTKAIRPAGTFTVNTGSAAILPSFLGDALWRSPTIGAACDTVDTVLLLAALGRVRRLTNAWQRTAAAAVLAGLLSNLVDRLGGSSVFHAGLPRGSIDWIPVPAWPTARANIADVVIALGVLALLYHPARHALLAVHDLARRCRAAHRGAAAGLIAVAIWTTMWQANRNTMEHRPTTQSETFAQCSTSYPSDGMDWVSYRPTAGPLAASPTQQQTVPGCPGQHPPKYHKAPGPPRSYGSPTPPGLSLRGRASDPAGAATESGVCRPTWRSTRRLPTIRAAGRAP
jgi:lipoprotein signal peptidase